MSRKYCHVHSSWALESYFMEFRQRSDGNRKREHYHRQHRNVVIIFIHIWNDYNITELWEILHMLNIIITIIWSYKSNVTRDDQLFVFIYCSSCPCYATQLGNSGRTGTTQTHCQSRILPYYPLYPRTEVAATGNVTIPPNLRVP